MKPRYLLISLAAIGAAAAALLVAFDHRATGTATAVDHRTGTMATKEVGTRRSPPPASPPALHLGEARPVGRPIVPPTPASRNTVASAPVEIGERRSVDELPLAKHTKVIAIGEFRDVNAPLARAQRESARAPNVIGEVRDADDSAPGHGPEAQRGPVALGPRLDADAPGFPRAEGRSPKHIGPPLDAAAFGARP